MSFGLRDEDWVDPDPEEIKCRDCTRWAECPCGCGWGWCKAMDDFTKGDWEC